MEILKILGLLQLFVVVQLCIGASVPTPPVLQIKQGKIKGGVGETRGGRHYSEFLGIPYVSKPNRFELAKAGPTWKDVRDATKFGSKCAQYRRELKEIIGSEDCLYLNVFTPEFPKENVIKPKALLPVMVFIHGGSFLFYSGEVLSPKYLLDEDIVLVTFNYRIGALGFLNTEDRSVVANLGMKDQVAALKWVQENIESFGGDAKRVTIFGNSAGSASVSYHVLSPMSKNLFSRAISQSGTALCPWAYVPNPGKVATTLGEKLSCPTKTTTELVDCLKKKTTKEIVEQQQKLLGSLSADPPVPFAPSPENLFVQTRSESMDDFLPDAPKKLLQQGQFNNVPYIIGVNSMDGLTFAAATILNSSQLVERIDKGFETIAPAILSFRATTEKPAEVAKQVREFYFGKNKISAESMESTEKFAQMLSDRNFFQCSQNTAVMTAKQNPVFLYYFDRDNGDSFLDHFGTTSAQKIKGVKHQDEIQYLTSSPYFPEIGKNSKHLVFSQNMIKLWTSFAAEGKPTRTWGKAGPWAPIPAPESEGKVPLTYYFLNDDPKFSQVPFTPRVKFWDSLPLNKQPTSAVPPPLVIGEMRKSPPPSPISAPSPKTPLVASSDKLKPMMAMPPIVVGHTGASSPPPPIAVASKDGKQEATVVAAKPSTAVQSSPAAGPGKSTKEPSDKTASSPAPGAKSSASTPSAPVHSHVFPDHDDGAQSSTTAASTSSTASSTTSSTTSSTSSPSTSSSSSTSTKKPGFFSRITG